MSEISVQATGKLFVEFSLKALRKAGYRITQQRAAVIKCLSKTHVPLSATEIYDQLSKSLKGACPDKVSIYRALDSLLELDLVHRVSPDGAYIPCRHRECTGSHHVLSRCTDCNEVRELDVPQEVVAPLLFHLRSSLRFTPDSHLLHIDGLCPECSSN